MTVKLTVVSVPATCGQCSSFESWNDGACAHDGPADQNRINADKNEAPPTNCPRRDEILVDGIVLSPFEAQVYAAKFANLTDFGPWPPGGGRSPEEHARNIRNYAEKYHSVAASAVRWLRIVKGAAS